MVGGLSVKSRFLLGAGATLLIGVLGGVPLPARAADLGGDCCADLEERVAELEATTVRKGNKKVTIELYGDVNKNVLYWDDGVERNTYVEDNGYKTSRFGFRGKAKITEDWSGGYRLEIETRNARSRNLDQIDDDNTDDSLGSLAVRHSYIYLNSKSYGELRWGLTWSAKDDITKDTHVLGTIVDTMHSDFFFNNDFFLRSKLVPDGQSLAAGSATTTAIRWQDLERCYSSSSAVFDCSTRRNNVVYVTPKFFGSNENNGLWFNWAWGEDDIWSGSARYKEEAPNWKIGAGVAYENFSDERVQNGGGGLAGFQQNLNEWGGEASLLHKPTGLFANFSWTTSENDSSNAFGVFTLKPLPTEVAWDISGGIQKKWWDLGNTTIWGGYTHVDGVIGIGLTKPGGVGGLSAGSFPGIDIATQITGSEVRKWYLAFDQEVVAGAMDFYVGYQHISGDLDLVDSALNPVAAPFYDFDLVFSGARIYF
jgi:predicted porin